jgi:hypothetical protein
MNTRKLLTFSLVALSFAAVTPALALNPQPEPPNKPRLSNMRLGQGPGGDHFRPTHSVRPFSGLRQRR